MLKSWSIENFKSIVNSGELQLAPVTVLAGLNSSGKSSFLQSILMISQTLSSPNADRPLLPNGPLVQLGTFEHILNDRSGLNTLTIGFEIIGEKERRKEILDASGISTVKLCTVFSAGKEGDKSPSITEVSNISLDRVSIDIKSNFFLANKEIDVIRSKQKFEIQRFTDAEKEISEFLKDVVSEYQNLVPSGDRKSIYQGFFGTNLENAQNCLITFSHFLPDQMIGKFRLDERRKDLLSVLEELNKLVKFLEKRTIDKAIVSEDEINIDNDDTLRMLNKLIMKNKDAEGLEILPDISYYPTHLSFEWITRFFTSKIRYLGPLRADPSTVQQQFAPTSELDDVGQKGEYAAVVYQANQLAQIEYYDPSSLQVEKATLQEALNKWAQYLGVASRVRAEKLNGINWQVALKEGQQPRLLPEVGFGVSQILPILVMGLLAPKNTLLLIEQPELHLHPRVQARLGDFFVGLAKCNKQCIIETHSENLVSQLRYHIVQAGGQEKSDCMIYFVDQDETGASRFDPVEISPNGNILNWPDGFFDETMLQEDRITAASLKKRAGNAQKG
jgi:predicted ATPase